MKKRILITSITLLMMQALYFVTPANVHAEEMTCSDHRSVTINIKPGDYPNKINLSAKGLLPVAVLTTQDFDASQFMPEMAHLNDAAIPMTEGCMGPAAIRWNYSDVNRDGRLDLVFFFKIQELNLTASSTAATLMAHGSYESVDIHITGTDSVLVKP